MNDICYPYVDFRAPLQGVSSAWDLCGLPIEILPLGSGAILDCCKYAAEVLVWHFSRIIPGQLQAWRAGALVGEHLDQLANQFPGKSNLRPVGYPSEVSLDLALSDCGKMSMRSVVAFNKPLINQAHLRVLPNSVRGFHVGRFFFTLFFKSDTNLR